MDTLRVATDQLLATASSWHGLSADLLTNAPSGLGLSCQPSAAAVNAVHAGAVGAGDIFAARTQITAVKTIAAATAYTSREASSGDVLKAVIESL